MLAFSRSGAHCLHTLALPNLVLAGVCVVALGACSGDPEDTAQTHGDTVPDAATPTDGGSESDASVGRLDAGPTSSAAHSDASSPASVSFPTALPSASGSTPASVTATAPPSGSAVPSSTSTGMPSPSSSWVTVVDPPEGLTDCQESETLSDSCSYRLKCLSNDITVACDPAEDGGFRCSCKDAKVWIDREFGVFEVELASACRAGVDLCRNRETELSEPVCSLTGSVTEAHQCARTVSCVATGAIESGAVIEVYTPGPSSACAAAGGENRMVCDCSNRAFDSHIVVGTDASQACDAILDVCNETLPIGEALACEEPTLEVTNDSCGLRKLCGLRTELDAEAGIFALSDVSDNSVECTDVDDQRADCHCRRAGLESWFDAATSTTEAACQGVASVCFGDVSLAASEPVVCDGVDVTTEPGNSCTSFASCRQAVPVDEGTVFLDGTISAECAPTGNAGEWECGCVSNIDSTERFIQTSSDAIGVCAATLSLCESLVSGVGFDVIGEESFEFGPLTDAGAP